MLLRLNIVFGRICGVSVEFISFKFFFVVNSKACYYTMSLNFIFLYLNVI